MVCKQLENVIAGYLWQVWDKNGWLYEGQYGFRQGYSCESQDIRLCEDIADFLDEWVSIDAITIDFSKAFDLVPHDRLLTKLAVTGVDSSVVVWEREFLYWSYTKVQSRRAIIQGSQSNLRCAARERLGHTAVSSVRQ